MAGFNFNDDRTFLGANHYQSYCRNGRLGNVNAAATATQGAVGRRIKRAHANAVENLVIFAPLALAVQMTSVSTTTTATACMVYFFARLVHVVAYIAAVPLVRTLAFTAGFFSQMALALTLLGVL